MILEDRLAQIQLLILDVDATLTPGMLHVNEELVHGRSFHVQDGLAIRKAQEVDLQVGIISHSSQPEAIGLRATNLGITLCHTGEGVKATILTQWADQLQIPLTNVAAIGDDINDMSMFAVCGLCACPADAVWRVQQEVDIVLSKQGGGGCVREFMDLYVIPAKTQPIRDV